MSYRRYYRRPHYRRPYYYRRSSNSGGKIFAAVVVLFLFGFISSIFANSGILFLILGLAIFIAIIVLVIKGVRKLFKWGSQPPESGIARVSQQDVAQINSEKHGCKCYMEGLSYGEQEVADTLSRELNYKDYFIFNNLIIPSDNNGSTQIDHIVVSKFGIFVIESKDYQGWIFGDKDQPFWTQSLPGGKNKFQFQNPIRQNYAHIMALKALMLFAANSFYSIVVFSDKSETKTAPIENVVHLNELIECVKKYNVEKLTENDLQLAIGKLSYACQTSDITVSEHIANLHENQNSPE
jgi:restriction system protein